MEGWMRRQDGWMDDMRGARLVNNLDRFPALMERESSMENTTKDKWIWGLFLTVREALSEEET